MILKRLAASEAQKLTVSIAFFVNIKLLNLVVKPIRYSFRQIVVGQIIKLIQCSNVQCKKRIVLTKSLPT